MAGRERPRGAAEREPGAGSRWLLLLRVERRAPEEEERRGGEEVVQAAFVGAGSVAFIV